MISREQALAASSPYLWVLAGEAVALAFAVAGWNVWVYREQLLVRTVRLLEAAHR